MKLIADCILQKKKKICEPEYIAIKLSEMKTDKKKKKQTEHQWPVEQLQVV